MVRIPKWNPIFPGSAAQLEYTGTILHKWPKYPQNKMIAHQHFKALMGISKIHFMFQIKTWWIATDLSSVGEKQNVQQHIIYER